MIDSCRLCGSSDLHLIMTDGVDRNLNYYRCDNCSMWNYDLDCGLDQTQYTEVYSSPSVPALKTNVDQSHSWGYVKQRLPEPGALLDIGCGNGGLLYFARNDGWQVRGLELSAGAAKSIKEDTGIDVVVADFLSYDGDDAGTYDLVALRHVLEHLPDSIRAMEQINRLLKPNGHALLEFPNTASAAYLFKRFLKNRGLKNKKYSKDWRPGHCNEFCRKAFEFLLEKTEFELVDWQTYSSKPIKNFIFRLAPIGSKARVLVRKTG